MSERRAAQLETENHQLKVKLNQKEVELEKTQSARDVNNRKGKKITVNPPHRKVRSQPET